MVHPLAILWGGGGASLNYRATLSSRNVINTILINIPNAQSSSRALAKEAPLPNRWY